MRGYLALDAMGGSESSGLAADLLPDMIHSGTYWRWAALVTCVAIAAVAFGAPDPNFRLRSALAIHDFGHVVAVGSVTTLLALALNGRSSATLKSRVRAICLAASAALALGAAVELAQAASGLHGDPWDVMRDVGGAFSAALILIALDRAISRSARAGLAGAAIAVIAVFSYPVFAALDDEARARAQFPVLASFANTKELSRFHFGRGPQPEIVQMTDHEGRVVSGMRLQLPRGRYPGFVLRHFPGDWEGMRALQLLLVIPEPMPLEMTVRIDDADYDYRLDLDDRYNRSFALSPGLNRIEIPLSDVAAAPRRRKFDLGRVQTLLMYAIDLDQPRSIIIGPMSLMR